jgi:hypothetical protein
MDPSDQLDALIGRLRARAGDPQRRADAPQSAFSASIASMSLGNLFSAGRAAALDLRRVVEMNQAGRIDPELHVKAEDIHRAMSTPAETDVRPVASEALVASVEAELGGRLPLALRRAYREVADGGFGPGGGLLSLAAAMAAYRGLSSEPYLPSGSTWPVGLLPILEAHPGYTCVDVATGQVIDWDPEELTERSGETAWRRSFSAASPSVEAWLEAWVGSRPSQEVMQEELDRSTVEQARQSRAMIAAMTPEQREAMGLPEVGWERVVWGGIGLDEP